MLYVFVHFPVSNLCISTLYIFLFLFSRHPSFFSNLQDLDAIFVVCCHSDREKAKHCFILMATLLIGGPAQ